MSDYPHVQAAFINALREEGTKKEACDWLQKTWNELCAVRAELRAANVIRAATLEEAAQVADDIHAANKGDNDYCAGVRMGALMVADDIRALKEQP